MLWELVRANAASHGSRTAIECGDVRLCLEELAEQTGRLAAGLTSIGVERGDCVVVLEGDLVL